MRLILSSNVEPWSRRHAALLSYRTHGPLHQRLTIGGESFLIHDRGGPVGYMEACGPEGPRNCIASIWLETVEPRVRIPVVLKLAQDHGLEQILVRSDDRLLAESLAPYLPPPFAGYFAHLPGDAPGSSRPAKLKALRSAAIGAVVDLLAETDPALGGRAGISAEIIERGEPGVERWVLWRRGSVAATGCRLYNDSRYDDTEVIVAPSLRREGIGASVLRALIDRSCSLGRGVLSGIRYDNRPSLGMARKAGLRRFCDLFRLSLSALSRTRSELP